jgi:predicted PurR-regulated permease PerM
LQVINTVVFVLGLIIVPIWMFHVMYDHRTIQRMLDRVVPDKVRNDFWAIARLVDSLLSSYIRGQVTLSIVVGSAVGVGLFLIGLFGFKVNYILLLAVIAGLTEFIPVIGPVLGAIPAVVIALFVSPGTVVAVIIVYAAIQALESAFLVPRIIGDSVGIHPAVIMILMIIAGQIFGFLGILLVAPISAMSRDVFLYVYGRLKGRPCPPGVLPRYDDDESPAEGEQHTATDEGTGGTGEAAQPASVKNVSNEE